MRRAYSTSPICTPARGVMWTGRFPSQTGVLANDHGIPSGETCFADYLNAAGIRTSYVGKWHLGSSGNIAVPPSMRAGFQEFIGYQCYNDYHRDVFFYDESERCRVSSKHRTDATTEIALERLKVLAARGQRFALCVSYQNPHYPVQPSPVYEAIYHGQPVHRRPNALDVDPYTPTWSPRAMPPEDPAFKRYGGNLDEYLRLYYAMVTQLDANVGHLLNALDELGLADSTAFVFSSDHGDMQGSQGLTNKGIFWEESVRIPFIARLPGAVRGTVSDSLISTLDFMPTFLDVLGLPPAPLAEGRSLAPVLRGAGGGEPGMVLAENMQGDAWWMIMDQRFKLVTTRETFVPSHLFDLMMDPYEQNNLVDATAYADVRECLLRHLLHRHDAMMKRRTPA